MAAGVGDGFGYVATPPRRFSGGCAVWFQGKRLLILGRVSMGSCAVDVTDLPEGSIRPGDAVELTGPNQSVFEIAASRKTAPQEILTGLGHRFKRVYSNEPPARGKEIML